MFMAQPIYRSFYKTNTLMKSASSGDETSNAPGDLSVTIKLVQTSWMNVKNNGGGNGGCTGWWPAEEGDSAGAKSDAAKAAAANLADVGETLMKNIFVIAPGALELFSFKDEPNMYESKAFKSHALKVINAVGLAVDGLNDLENLVPKLKSLG
jgi:hypothetical protein